MAGYGRGRSSGIEIVVEFISRPKIGGVPHLPMMGMRVEVMWRSEFIRGEVRTSPMLVPIFVRR